MKTAFVIGHTPYGKGAFSKHLKKYEFDFYLSFKDDLEKMGDVFVHDNNLGYTSRQKAMGKNTKEYDLVFELHFNAANGKAGGCEALHYFRNDKASLVCDFFCESFCEKTGIKNRGGKELSNAEQRGYGFVYYQKPTAIILEPFFGDNENDCEKFNSESLLKTIKESIDFYDQL